MTRGLSNSAARDTPPTTADRVIPAIHGAEHFGGLRHAWLLSCHPHDLHVIPTSDCHPGLPGVELAMVQGGFIRAKKDYLPGEFTLGDLFGEFAFEGPQACVVP